MKRKDIYRRVRTTRKRLGARFHGDGWSHPLVVAARKAVGRMLAN